MKIIYCYRKNVYAAFTAAYLHLHLDLQLIPQRISTNCTRLYYVGLDEKYNEVYLICCGKNKNIFLNILKGLETIYQDQIKIIDLIQFDHLLYRFSKKKTAEEIKKMIENAKDCEG